MSAQKVLGVFSLEHALSEEKVRMVSQFEKRAGYEALTEMVNELNAGQQSSGAYTNMDGVLGSLANACKDIEALQKARQQFVQQHQDVGVAAQQQIRSEREAATATLNTSS